MDYGLTRELMDEGKMPNFSRLEKEGSFSALGTSIPPQSPVAWSNFISGMDAGVLRAKVPMAELYQYSASLKSITSGAGNYTMTFSHYEPIPAHIAQKVIDETQREKEEAAKK